MFDVHQLQVFLAVAEKLSFTRAAEGLFLTQCAVSHQIAKLEASVSCELLTRPGRAVSLTPAGRQLGPPPPRAPRDGPPGPPGARRGRRGGGRGPARRQSGPGPAAHRRLLDRLP